MERQNVLLHGHQYTQITYEEHNNYKKYFNVSTKKKLQISHETACYKFMFMMYLVDTRNLIELHHYIICLKTREEPENINIINVYVNDENIYLSTDTNEIEIKKWVDDIQFFKSNDVNIQKFFPGYSQKLFLNMLFQFLNLTDDMLIYIRAMYCKSDLLLVGRKNVWLNDRVINSYFELIKKRSIDKSIYVFDTFFWEAFSRCKFKYDPIIKKKTTKIDFLAFKKILIPLNFCKHWALIEINIESKTIAYYDSIESSFIKHFYHFTHKFLSLIAYVFHENFPGENAVSYVDTWKVINGESPSQINEYDSGVFVCINANLISINRPLDYSSQHINLLRQKIVQECLNGALMSDSGS